MSEFSDKYGAELLSSDKELVLEAAKKITEKVDPDFVNYAGKIAVSRLVVVDGVEHRLVANSRSNEYTFISERSSALPGFTPTAEMRGRIDKVLDCAVSPENLEWNVRRVNFCRLLGRMGVERFLMKSESFVCLGWEKVARLNSEDGRAGVRGGPELDMCDEGLAGLMQDARDLQIQERYLDLANAIEALGDYYQIDK